MQMMIAFCALLMLQATGSAPAVTAITTPSQPRNIGTVLISPSVDQKKSKPAILMARNGYGSLQAAINSQNGPYQIYLSCGTYTENIVVSRSDVRILGEERGCVQIEPADPTL